MPTILTHALLPVIAGMAMGRERVSPSLWAAGIVASVLPDADVVGFRLGIPYGAELGHRGASHSLAAAIALGVVAALFAGRLRASPLLAFLFVALSAASHGLTDMLTNGGRGVALWWPLGDGRLFWPVRPVEVSAIGMRALSEWSLANVLLSELLWIVLPVALLGILFHRLAAPHIDLTRGQS